MRASLSKLRGHLVSPLDRFALQYQSPPTSQNKEPADPENVDFFLFESQQVCGQPCLPADRC